MARKDYIYMKDKNGKYRPVHRIVMEEFLGRELSKEEIIHHKDGNKKNNSLENLSIMTQEKHASLHHAGKNKNYPINSKRNRLNEEIIKKIKKISKSMPKINYSKIKRILKLDGIEISDYTISRYVNGKNRNCKSK